MSETPETRAYQVVASARSALELASEALAMFEERRPGIIGYGASHPATDGRRVELMQRGPLERRTYIGAQAFVSNLVVVENCIARLTRIEGLPEAIRISATAALLGIEGLVDRRVRHTIEHIDQRAANTQGKSLVCSTILEDDLLCSTRDDGSVGTVAITRVTLEKVERALMGIFWPKETLDRIVAWAEEREERVARAAAGRTPDA